MKEAYETPSIITYTPAQLTELIGPAQGYGGGDGRPSGHPGPFEPLKTSLFQ